MFTCVIIVAISQSASWPISHGNRCTRRMQSS